LAAENIADGLATRRCAVLGGLMMVKHLLAAAAVIALAWGSVAHAQYPSTSTPNVFGGSNYSSGGYSARNVFGGYNYFPPSGGMTYSTPNVFGGSNYSSGGYSARNVFGGYNYFPR
jgi:hypothetical protein